MTSRWLYFPTPASGETVLDTYTLAGNTWRWRSTNGWWNRWHLGTWSSTSSATGTYLTVDNGSQIQGGFIRFGSIGSGIPSDARIRLTVSPSTGGVKTSVEGAPAASDARFYWIDSGGSTISFTDAEIENGGTFGWDQTDSITLELFTP
tara:strand:+ start:1014 stop:1460 length:447 start_codon:yes stop_codon:yes gene_type:complete